jgi:phosphoserine phosphatase
MTAEIIYFVRHGETDLNLEFRCQGRQDISLNERGRGQIAETAERFKAIRVDSIYSSPLARAIESAEIIAERKKLPVRTLDWLMEIDHGGMEGLNGRESEEKFPGLLEKWHSEADRVKFPGGESLADVAGRVAAGLKALIEGENGSVMLVTHQVVSSVARSVLDGTPLSGIWQGKLVNGDFFKFEMNRERIARTAAFSPK